MLIFVRTKTKNTNMKTASKKTNECFHEMPTWLSTTENPLITKDEKGNWTCTEDGDKPFIAALQYEDKRQPGKTLWWIYHCVIEDTIGLCVVGDDLENSPAGWEIEDIEFFIPMIAPPNVNKGVNAVQRYTGKWNDASVSQPELIEKENYSQNVLAVCNGELSIMCYCYIPGEDGGYIWANCNGQIDGDAEFDDDYDVTHWMQFPSLPIIGL